ncbi:hypothetical protein TcasGA2_TC001361 [Tribolium castaneum]|uniref:Uncharacterized protein n=1 Tax=Tribolium castaneum TaxID=7070 RepID=D6WCD1_TRICA|nr:hypothetical protein TcasGA2_TC001361 [Tribolium castaneum]
MSEESSDTGSEISLSEKIVFESNEKRLRERMTSLQNSIMDLKQQLKLEKELWKEDMEKIRILQMQQHEFKCTCALHSTKSKESCVSLIGSGETYNLYDKYKPQSIKQLLELQNYKRKLAETENMCNLELTRVKQSLDDLKTLQSIASEWGKKEMEQSVAKSEPEAIQEIFVNKI